MIHPDPAVVIGLTSNPLNKIFNETLQDYENPKRLETFIDEIRLCVAIVELVKERHEIFSELKDSKKKSEHTKRLKSYITFLIPSLNLENRAPRKHTGNDATVRSSLLKVGFYVNLFIGVSFSIDRVTKFDTILLRSLEKHGHVLNEALKYFTGFVQDRFYDALPNLGFHEDWAEDYKHFENNIEHKREERKPKYFKQLPGQEAPIAQPASGQRRKDSDTLRKRGAKSCNESGENDHAAAQHLQKRAKTGAESHPEVPTVENTVECLQEHQISNVGHLTTSPSGTTEPELVPLHAIRKSIDSRMALRFLKDSKLGQPSAMLQRPKLTDYSYLTYFPLEAAITTLESFETEDAVWREFIRDAQMDVKNSEDSLKLLSDNLFSVFQDALLLKFSDATPRYHLVFYFNPATGEALARLPSVPMTYSNA